MPVDIDLLEENIDVIEMNDINNLEVSAMGDLFIKYANSNHPQTPEEVFDEPLTDGVIHAYIGFYVGYEMPIPEAIPTSFHWCVRDLTAIQEELTRLNEEKQDKLDAIQMQAVNSGINSEKVEKYENYDARINSKQDQLNENQMNAVNSGITESKVESYSLHIANKNNPHNVTKQQLGLENVVNTGDTSNPIENSAEKFTSGGAFTLQRNLQNDYNTKLASLNTKINNVEVAKQDKLVNQQNIKSINGESILGSGNMEVSFNPQILEICVGYEEED